MNRCILLPIGDASRHGSQSGIVECLYHLHLSDTVSRQTFSVHIDADLLSSFTVHGHVIDGLQLTQFIGQIIGIFFQFPIRAILAFQCNQRGTGSTEVIVYGNGQYTLW